MNSKVALVITTISKPNDALLEFAEGCQKNNIRMIIVGDKKSPPNFYIKGAEYFSIEEQKKNGLKFAQICPENHYSRKNIGYLIAIRDGAEIIMETDDDNFPKSSFWRKYHRINHVKSIDENGWYNIYRIYSKETVWPRGFPLDEIKYGNKLIKNSESLFCPIQQGLADSNPDVDAIYRLTSSLPINFTNKFSIALKKGVWCPFNSQNTVWFSEAFKLMYLPGTCSFRMTDIWRSFVAQRIAWDMGWPILFHGPTVVQKRNEHNIMNDFKDEVVGYLNNKLICEKLDKLVFNEKGNSAILQNMIEAYSIFHEMGIIKQNEFELLNAWIEDFQGLQ